MDFGQLQGWHADPFGIHQMRYFSAGTPTRLVRDGDVEAYDDPPAGPDDAPGEPEAATAGEASPDEQAASAGQVAAAGGAGDVAAADAPGTAAAEAAPEAAEAAGAGLPGDAGGAGADAAPDSAVPAAVAAAADEAGAGAAGDVVDASDAVQAGEDGGAGHAGDAVGPGAAGDPGAGTGAPAGGPVPAGLQAAASRPAEPPPAAVTVPAPARSRRLSPAFIAVALVAAAAVISFIAFQGTGSPASHSGRAGVSGSSSGGGGTGGANSAGMSPAAFVTAAAHKTLSRQTADFTLTGTVRADGQAVTMTGNGQEDLSRAAYLMKFALGAGGGKVTEEELVTGGNAYIELAGGPSSASMAQLTGGKHWIEVPFGQSQQAKTAVTGDAGSELALLEQEGAHVTPRGTRQIGGRSCAGYAVTPTTQALQAAARRDGVPAAQVQALAGVTPPTVDVWFDPATQLACQMVVTSQVPNLSAGNPSTIELTITMTKYGVPVSTVTAPSPSDTVTLQQLLAIAAGSKPS